MPSFLYSSHALQFKALIKRLLTVNSFAFAVCVGVYVSAHGQTAVLTAHNDIARTGQNLQETILAPSNVNPQQFGRLFSSTVTGQVFAQPLYVPQIAIFGKGVHNAVYVATSADMVYAFDGDDNGGINSTPLWKTSLLTNTAPAGAYKSKFGVYGTPVIDLLSKTLYLVSSETRSSASLYRLHALDLTSGAEKFGGPVEIRASQPGTGSGSSGGVLAFDPAYHVQRPGLLLLNGIVYTAFGSINDTGPWHGWVFSHDASTLRQIDAFCTSPNGSGGGIWMGGAGLAAEVNDPNKPYGRLFLSTGNGSFAATKPYDRTMSYGMSVLDLDLSGGIISVKDEFTPYNQAALNAQDGDLGSSGPLLLPAQTQASANSPGSLIQVGKPGTIYLLNRSNLGGFNTIADQAAEEVQTPRSGPQSWGAGVWGTEAYWNNALYYGGTKPSTSNSLAAYTFSNGILSSTPASETVEQFSYPGPTPSISANGTASGIVWVLNHGTSNLASAVLLAYNARDLGALLYSSNANLSRDDPGTYVKFTLPTIANGRVYVGTSNQFSVYGLLNSAPTAASPAFSPAGATFTGSQTISIGDTTDRASIYYTIDGSTPTTASTLYSAPITISANATVRAIASATGYLQSAPSTATFSSTANTPNPVYSLNSGTYSGVQSLVITDAASNAVVYYTLDGSLPTTGSPIYIRPITIAVSETIRAIAIAQGLLPSSIVGAAYTVNPVYTLDFSQGFAQSQQSGQMQINGSTGLDDFRLQLTNGGQNQAGSAFSTNKVNVQSFTTDFTFQLSNAIGDGFTFTIQNNTAAALGDSAAGLGYHSIRKSVAVKFDFYSNYGESSNSTGIYKNGTLPTTPAIDLLNSGIDLNNGDYINAHITYDGTSLNLTLIDDVTLATWSHSFSVDIPGTVGGNNAYVGFTAGTGRSSASQKISFWTYLSGPPSLPNYPSGFDSAGINTNAAASVSGTALQLTDGGSSEANSAFFNVPVNVNSFFTAFDFQVLPGPTAVMGDGFTLVLQNSGPQAVGLFGSGLGYAGLPNSVAIKFDLYSNAGEGTDSTGLYVNGATPTLPAMDLTSTNVQIGSGDLIHVEVSYDGAILTWTLHDLTHSHNASKQVAINIPSTIGSNTAYAGFTAGSGDATSIISILNWTLINP